MAIIAASILDADFAQLRSEVERVDRAGVDMFTLDIMDGRFAPRITFGDYVVACIRKWTQRPLEVHLMIEEPERWVNRFIDVGADLVVFHLEATKRPGEVLAAVRKRSRSVGIALLAETPVSNVFEWVDKVDVVNFLAVPVGFGGNASAPDTLDRIRQLRRYATGINPNLVIEVDGGVKPHNALEYVYAGADMLTVGTGIYHATDVDEAVRQLRGTTIGAEDELARERGAAFLERRAQSPEDAQRQARRLSELADELGVQIGE